MYLDGDPKVTDVYKRDFFHDVFHKMVSPKFGMFVFNDPKTLAWFPSRVRLVYPYTGKIFLNYRLRILWMDLSFLFFSFPQTTHTLKHTFKQLPKIFIVFYFYQFRQQARRGQSSSCLAFCVDWPCTTRVSYTYHSPWLCSRSYSACSQHWRTWKTSAVLESQCSSYYQFQFMVLHCDSERS